MSPPHRWCVRLHDCTAAAARRAPWHHPGVSALGIHHVGIAVRDLEVARARYERLYGARVEARERVEEQGVEALALLLGESRPRRAAGAARATTRRSGASSRGAARACTISPSASPICAAELAQLRAAGATLIDEQPRAGIYGARGIRAPRVARRRAERAGAGDDGDGGVMDRQQRQVRARLPRRRLGRGRGEQRGLGARRGRPRRGHGHGRHRARRAPHLAARRRRRLRRARRAAPPRRRLQLVAGCRPPGASACSIAS